MIEGVPEHEVGYAAMRLFGYEADGGGPAWNRGVALLTKAFDRLDLDSSQELTNLLLGVYTAGSELTQATADAILAADPKRGRSDIATELGPLDLPTQTSNRAVASLSTVRAR